MANIVAIFAMKNMAWYEKSGEVRSGQRKEGKRRRNVMKKIRSI